MYSFLQVTFYLCLSRRIVTRASFVKTPEKRESMFPETFTACACFPNISQICHTGIEHLLTRIRPCEQWRKFCDHEQASTYLIFASNSSKGQIFRALLNWMEPLNAPQRGSKILICVRDLFQDSEPQPWSYGDVRDDANLGFSDAIV